MYSNAGFHGPDRHVSKTCEQCQLPRLISEVNKVLAWEYHGVIKAVRDRCFLGRREVGRMRTELNIIVGLTGKSS